MTLTLALFLGCLYCLKFHCISCVNGFVSFMVTIIYKGAWDGTVVRALTSHQCGPGSNPGVDSMCGLSLSLVLSFAQRCFSPGTPVFPSPQKLTIPNFNLIRNQVDEERLCGCATSKSLVTCIYL